MAGILPTIIDISEFQGGVAWATCKSNIHFAIIRVQDGTYQDARAGRNISECERLGIPYYVYGFYRNGGAVEAARLVSRTKALGGANCRGHVLDVEVGGQSVAGINSAVATLNQTWRDTGVYIANHLYSQYAGVKGQKWTWIPTYGVNDGAAHTPPRHYCDLWQFTSAGRVPGIGGNVDCNALNGKRDLASFTAGTKPVEPQKPEQADPSLPLHVLVGNVLSGMYGNGENRKTSLGSRYAEVQEAVNHVCVAKVSVLADEVLAGKWSNGDERKRALGTRYDEVQEEINRRAGASAKKTVDQIADEVLAGKWGNGQGRRNRLASAGYDPDAVQAKVNAKLGVTSSNARCYTVKSGDTLSEIGAELGVNWKDIAAKNGISSPYTIYPGQVLEV